MMMKSSGIIAVSTSFPDELSGKIRLDLQRGSCTSSLCLLASNTFLAAGRMFPSVREYLKRNYRVNEKSTVVHFHLKLYLLLKSTN